MATTGDEAEWVGAWPQVVALRSGGPHTLAIPGDHGMHAGSGRRMQWWGWRPLTELWAFMHDEAPWVTTSEPFQDPEPEREAA